MYHAFGHRPPEGDPHALFVRAEDFERQVLLLRRYFRPIALREYVAARGGARCPPRSVLVTIDDGYSSTATVAAPILARHSVPAVVFICPERLGTRLASTSEKLVTVDEVRELARAGIEIGAHGLDHTLLPGLPEAELRRQVAGARDAVADVVGARPAAFAYPEGRFDSAAVSAVREAGYSVAFSVLDGGGHFAIPRIPITSRDAHITFAAKLLPGFLPLFAMTADLRPVRRIAARLAGQRRAAGPG